jgi:hypothetical protein
MKATSGDVVLEELSVFKSLGIQLVYMELKKSESTLLSDRKNIKRLFDLYQQGWCCGEFDDL